MTKDEATARSAMKLALEALETERENYQDWDKQDGAPEYIYEAITALREALAEQSAQQQEPYGWHTEDHLTDRSATTYSKDVADRWKSKGWPVTPLYTSPQEQPSKPWVGLTPEQRAAIAEANNMLVDDDLFDAIEAELKEKNA